MNTLNTDTAHLREIELLQHSQNIARVGSWEFLPGEEHVYCTNALFRMLELPVPHGNLITTTEIISHVHPAHVRPLKQHLQAMKHERSQEVELRVVTTTGKTLWLHVWCESLRDENNRICKWRGTCQDISSNKAIDEELDRQNDMLLQAETTARLGSWKYNFTTQHAYFSDNVYLLFGYTAGAFDDYQKLLERVVPEDQIRIMETYGQTIADGIPRNLTFRLNHPDGCQRFFTSHAKVTTNKKGESIIVGTVQDITEAHELSESLSQQKQFIERLIDASVNGISVYDLDQRIVLWNAKLASLYNVPKEAAIGKRFSEIMPGYDFDWFETLLQKAATGELIIFDNPSLIDHLYYHTSLIPLKNEQGETTHVFVLSTDVTRLKEQEHEIQVQRDFAELIIDNSVDCIFVFDKELRYISWNKKCEEFYGLKKEEVVGKKLQDVFPQQDVPVPAAQLQKAFAGTLLHYTMEPSATIDKYFESNIIPLKNHLGEVTHIMCVLHDATQIGRMTNRVKEVNRLLEQKNNELAERSLYLETLLDSTEDAVAAFDPELRITAFNKASEKRYNTTKSEVLGKPLVENFPSLAGSRHIQNLEKALAGETVYIPEQKDVFNNRYIENFIIPLRREDKVIGALAVAHDITDLKKAVIALQERTQFSQTLIDAIADVITAMDTNLCYTMWNKTAEMTFRLKKEDVLGKHVTEIFPFLENSEKIRVMYEVLQSGKPMKLLEAKYASNNGYCNIFYIPLKNTDGVITGMLSTVHDITALKTTSLQLEELNNQLASKNHELSRINSELASFSYVASHDLQEPLRKIQAFTSLILSKDLPKLSESGQDYFSRIQASANRMQQMIDGLLLFSRTNTAPKTFEKKSLKDIFRKAFLNLNDLVQQKKAVIEMGELPVVDLIPHQFEQLAEHIINNALKFQAPENTPHIMLSSGLVSGKDIQGEVALREKKYYKISVTDNGIGFEPEEAEKIFEMFHRLNAKHEYPGTGIGLSICRRIAQNHNGFITAESTPGEGSVFHIYLPQ